ncbi:FBD-associated F-box protein At4g10400-like [Abrus precatorius]|uniref:FBD-associated F-box protein At4g10400-like n=1 Tax=Abrus precatorius TaxID=3816 RepID=A0A8B8KWG7_ABRPR|nr:FBD-associated F-box protein At4g10400-like [Abrus precatorius]
MFNRRRNPAVDRVSALPDFILYKILSFLPTKQAVATSVLSKRWRPLWFSLPTLDLDDKAFATFERFSLFVYSLFLSRDITLPLRSFRLTCGNSSPCDPYAINRFVYAAVQRGLRHLHLNMKDNLQRYVRIKLPSCVLTCRTLTVLKLKKVAIDDLPYVDFPSLETLHLVWVSFRLHEDVMKFIAGCPILQDLRTKYLLGIRGHRGHGEVTSLPKLRRAEISNLDIPFSLLHNVDFLRAELKCTYFSDVPEFHNLTHMELIFEFTKWRWNWLLEALNHCPKLHHLTIQKVLKYKDAICDEDWEDPHFVPECISSLLKTCCLRNYKGIKCELQFAKYILQNSKVLRTMTIQSTFEVDMTEKLQMLMKLSVLPRSSATCKLSFE